MTNYNKEVLEGEKIFVGVDVHNRRWHMTIRTSDVELKTANIEGNWPSLEKMLEKYQQKQCGIVLVYEAGYFGYVLHDLAVNAGMKCLVTPPSMIPEQQGNRVKTDKRDSKKLALLLAKDMLKSVYIPSEQERAHRQVIRRRDQLVSDRVVAQNRIKAELKFNGIEIEGAYWSKQYLSNLWQVKFRDEFHQDSFESMLRQYEYLCKEIAVQTALIRKLTQHQEYAKNLEILNSIPGIGLLSAMHILLELPNLVRFRRGDQAAAICGLTPSQHSSGDKVRMGRITGIGKSKVRAVLTESAWTLIRKDPVMHKKFDQIKQRAGAKRAIVAIARKLILIIRRMLIDQKPYQMAQQAA